MNQSSLEIESSKELWVLVDCIVDTYVREMALCCGTQYMEWMEFTFIEYKNNLTYFLGVCSEF